MTDAPPEVLALMGAVALVYGRYLIPWMVRRRLG